MNLAQTYISNSIYKWVGLEVYLQAWTFLFIFVNKHEFGQLISNAKWVPLEFY